MNVNFGDQSMLGSIRGTRWHDANGDDRQAGEPGLAGKTMYLDTNDNRVRDAGEPTVGTGSDGGYVFSNLAAGSYVVRGDSTKLHTDFPRQYQRPNVRR